MRPLHQNVDLTHLITESALNVVWGNTSFGNMTKREVIADNLKKIENGYHISYIAYNILLQLGLITADNELQLLGIEYLKSLKLLEKRNDYDLGFHQYVVKVKEKKYPENKAITDTGINKYKHKKKSK